MPNYLKIEKQDSIDRKWRLVNIKTNETVLSCRLRSQAIALRDYIYTNYSTIDDLYNSRDKNYYELKHIIFSIKYKEPGTPDGFFIQHRGSHHSKPFEVWRLDPEELVGYYRTMKEALAAIQPGEKR